MRCIKMLVPRMLIKHHYQHPENYGESIVELLNGKVTDVYTHEKGHLYSMTNDVALVKYLRKNNLKDVFLLLSMDDVVLRSIRFTDILQVSKWIEEDGIFTLNNLEYTLDSAREFISHAITKYVHYFIIEVSHQTIGFIGYYVIDEIMHMHFRCYETSILNDSHLYTITNLVLEHIKANFSECDIVATKGDVDLKMKEIIIMQGFALNE